ncbi:MAG: divergent polysaccharide deacetylase family protein [Rhodospirillales bacterium]|nr:divergent polysaccharide deacetylase family protein [Rhodospirillales bacterium]
MRLVSGAWRGLAWFWATVLLLVVVGAAVLQALGPPRVAAPPPAAPPPTAPAPAAPAPAPAVAPAPTAALPPHPPGTVAPPDAALLEPSTVFPGGMLPRIDPGGLAPRVAYAAPFAAAAATHPRVAVLLGGIGMSGTDSEEAIRSLPGAVSLAVSPYAYRPEELLDEARAAGHELLLALPLEPERYPIDDPGNRALLTGNLAALNHQRLEWALTRFTGYVGATGALNGMRGERFAAVPELMHPLLQDLAQRGLLYIDPRPGAPPPPYVTGRSVDVVIDEPAVRTEIEAKLARLEEVARDRGAALGLVGLPRPVTLDRLAAWTATLAARGLTLAPVSAIVQPPPPPVQAGATPTRRPAE